MFINLTNHSSETWDADQLAEARKYGEIIDISFPAVPANADESYICALADSCLVKMTGYLNSDCVVLVQGEFTLVFVIVSRLKAQGIRTVAACSERISSTRTDKSGREIKESVFRFSRFREYCC